MKVKFHPHRMNVEVEMVSHSTAERKGVRPHLKTFAVGIATKGRPAILAKTIADLATQLRPPDRIIVAYTCPEDIAHAPFTFPYVSFLKGQLGLTAQRNLILEAVQTNDFVLFIDDDFYLAPDYLHITEEVFLHNIDVVLTTGTVLADGINNSGLSYSDAQTILTAAPQVESKTQLTPVFNGYGCNMAFRLDPIKKHRLRFDENLPLYGWFEDVEFSRQVAAYGSVVRIPGAFGVHLGVKAGRQSGIRLGYSQVANPIYLAGKGTFPWVEAAFRIGRRCLMNLIRSFAPEKHVDRRGRLRGNLLAFRELLNGNISPKRILNL
jgi:glycosyltransferase involved in cell wall biosynthesis